MSGIEKVNRPYTVISLFSGLGGLDLGFKWEGFKTIWANDIDLAAIESYKINFRINAINADIMKIPLTEIPKADVVVGGPPCQSFSLVGLRQHDDPRGMLVFRFLEIVKYIRPKAFVMENVPGMASSRIDGRRLSDVLEEEFSNLGYNVRQMHLTATDFLVPQKRKRLILLGCVGELPKEPIGTEFAEECYGIKLDKYDLSSKAAIGDLGECVIGNARSTYKKIEPSNFAKLMRMEGLTDYSLHICPRMSKTDRQLVQHIPPGGNYMDVPDELATGRILKFKNTGGRTTTYGRLHPDNPAYTINTYFRRPNVGCNFHYEYPRLITPREAMRFQSIPDHFEIIYSSQDQRNALIGNAVPPLMARAIARSLKETLDKI